MKKGCNYHLTLHPGDVIEDTSHIHNFHLGVNFVSGIGSIIGGAPGGEYFETIHEILGNKDTKNNFLSQHLSNIHTKEANIINQIKEVA